MPPRSNTHTIQTERQFEARSTESFNRVAYAIQLLKLLNPPLTVAVYGNRGHLLVERGRALGAQPAWALFGVPPHATRESIARALVELTGLERQPFLVDLLCAGAVEPLG
ncbi:MAG: hypothetical protein ABW061_14910 [Polyangiaceae bacterium]